MFEYFPNNYTWSLAVMSALNRGGQISEIDEACRPLREHAGKKALGGDPGAQQAWFESWMKVAERVERLGRADEEAGHPLSAGRKYLRAGLYYLLAERMPSHKDPRRLDAYKRGIDVYKRGLSRAGSRSSSSTSRSAPTSCLLFSRRRPARDGRLAWCISMDST